MSLPALRTPGKHTLFSAAVTAGSPVWAALPAARTAPLL